MEDNPEYKSERLAVPPAFRTVLSHFYVAANLSQQHIAKILAPSFEFLLVFSFGQPVSFTTEKGNHLFIEKCLLLGPLKQPLHYELPPGSEIFVANFKGDGFYRFFGHAADKYLAVHPDELILENCFSGIWHRLHEMRSDKERADFLLAFCEPYLRQSDATLKKIIDLKNDATALDPIKTIAKQIGQSERSVQIKHKKQLGYTAKEMLRYQRFLKGMEMVTQLATNAKKIDWFEIVETCHYYDQSQLIHDFQYYLHLSPSEYLTFLQDICSSR